MRLVAYMKRCMEVLEGTMPAEDRIKVLRALASTANMLADNIENDLEIQRQLKELNDA